MEDNAENSSGDGCMTKTRNCLSLNRWSGTNLETPCQNRTKRSISFYVWHNILCDLITLVHVLQYLFYTCGESDLGLTTSVILISSMLNLPPNIGV